MKNKIEGLNAKWKEVDGKLIAKLDGRTYIIENGAYTLTIKEGRKVVRKGAYKTIPHAKSAAILLK